MKHQTPIEILDEIETRAINALCYIKTDHKEAERQLRVIRDIARSALRSATP